MKKIITTPIKYEDIKDLKVGDIIYLTGYLVTGRDDVYNRVVKEGLDSPYDFKDGAVLHSGPIVSESDDKDEIISIGPTSSIRMESTAADFIEKTGVRIQVGKGGMGEKTSKACKTFGAIHCVYPGGCAALAADYVEEVETVYWRELGMPEAEWVMKVHEFGPLIVSIDTEGRNMFLENKEFYKENKEKCMKPIFDMVKDYMHVDN